MGHLYLLIKMHIADEFHEKNFWHILHRGEALEADPELIDYDPYATIEDALTQSMAPQVQASPKKAEGSKDLPILRVLERVFGPEREERKKTYQEIIQRFERPPETYMRLLRELEAPLTPQSFSFLDYMDLIYSWVTKRRKAVRRGDIPIILEHLVFDFIPKDNLDFPLGRLNIDQAKLKQMLIQTADLDEDHPRKWTRKRIEMFNQFKQSGEYYKALVVMSVSLYAWWKYRLDEEFPSDEVIRLKYIVDEFLFKTSFLLFSDLVVLRHNVGEGRWKFVFEAVDELCDELEIEPCMLLLEEQCENFFILKTEELPGNLAIEVSRLKDQITIDSDSALKILTEWDVITPVTPFSLLSK